MSDGRPSGRIELLDGLRGLSIILMVAYHCGVDLYLFGLLPEGVLYNPLLNTLQPIFAGVFIVLAGVSSRFSHSNLRRGLIMLACACVVTLATYVMGYAVWFGILHLLAACTLLFWLFEKLRITAVAVPALAFLALYFKVTRLPSAASGSADYFPLLPWLFLFFAGAYLGVPIRDGKFPRAFYEIRVPVLSTVGRHTLIIYMAHQPVLYGAVWLIARLVRG